MADKPKKGLRHIVAATWRIARRAIGYGLTGSVIVLITLVVIQLERRPDLDVWHTVHLDEEFTVDSPVDSMDAYLALEERLFTQLDEEIYAQTAAGDDRVVSRYRRGSLSDPARWPTNWNRTFQLHADDPPIGVLMLHGLSDSPYSNRSLAQRLHAQGATVISIRLPGHGTAPSGLLRTDWQDWAAAVELAMHSLRAQVPDRPLFIVGYSNGGALATLYALSALDDPSLPAPDGLILLSPEIGISRLAALAIWQERLGRVLGFRKLSWNSILFDHDPFKYDSFALNAARQAYQLTAEIQRRITAATSSGQIAAFPPLIAFQSAVDATVTARALVENLLKRLPANPRNELVVFDVNRMAEIAPLLAQDPQPGIDRMQGNLDLPFCLTVVTNRSPDSMAAVARRRPLGDETTVTTELGIDWPDDVFSLTHVALPFPPTDPVYGGDAAHESPGISLGDKALRGERGTLRIAAAGMLRLRWNPFHSYLEQRMLEFVDLADSSTPDATSGDSPP